VCKYGDIYDISAIIPFYTSLRSLNGGTPVLQCTVLIFNIAANPLWYGRPNVEESTDMVKLFTSI